MNLNYKIEDIARVTGGTLRGNGNEDIHRVFIDSRNHINPNNSLFIAIRGPYNDGHNYLLDLYQKGIRNFMIDRSSRKSLISKLRLFSKEADANFSDANIIVVNNTLEAMQRFSAYHRGHFGIPVIGVTGSNGKTIVKEWLYHFLREEYNVVRSPKSYNSQVGVPLSVFEMNNEHQLAIFEAGISHPGEMSKLHKIIAPTHGILTHIGTAHSQNFRSSSHLTSEKELLFDGCSSVTKFNKLGDTNYIIDSHNGSTTLNINNNDYVIPFADDASIQNATTCIHFLLKFGIEAEIIKSRAETLPQIALRLETRRGKNNNVIINDSYNSDISSLQIALNYLDRQDTNKSKFLILSDIQQDKLPARELFQQIADLINQRKVDRFIGIGSQMVKHRHLFSTGFFYENTEQFLTNFDPEEVKNSVILLKGARDYHFESIGKSLDDKTHETVLEINLSALAKNIKTYKNKLNEGTKLLCMVKAFGYGAGSKQISSTLHQAGVDYLGVAYTDEGVELRKDGVKTPIIVMNAEKGSFAELIEYNLEPSIYSFKQLDDFIRALIDMKLKAYPIHIKIDSGMKRLGFTKHLMHDLIANLISQPEVRIKSAFSHLAGSDDPMHDDFTQQQIRTFQYCTHQLESALGYSFIKHVLNSAGIERFSKYQMDMVRLGLGMYGESSALNNLETVGTLRTSVSQIKEIKKGESVGYSRSQFALNDMKIAIIPIGYADGFRRSLSNGYGHVWINGSLAPVFGKVSMDMTAIDISNIEVNEGDRVEIFGPNRPISNLATEMGTIPYEVMTSVSQRVVRVYTEE